MYPLKLEGLRVRLAEGLVAQLESAADGAWLVARDGVDDYTYALTARDHERLASAIRWNLNRPYRYRRRNI